MLKLQKVCVRSMTSVDPTKLCVPLFRKFKILTAPGIYIFDYILGTIVVHRLALLNWYLYHQIIKLLVIREILKLRERNW